MAKFSDVLAEYQNCTSKQLPVDHPKSIYPDIWEHSRSIENTRLQLMFSTFLSSSQMPFVFYHSVIHGLGFFAFKRYFKWSELSFGVLPS